MKPITLCLPAEYIDETMQSRDPIVYYLLAKATGVKSLTNGAPAVALVEYPSSDDGGGLVVTIRCASWWEKLAWRWKRR